MRRVAIMIAVVCAAGCGALPRSAGMYPLTRSTGAFVPELDVASGVLPCAGRHESHDEQDVGEVDFGEDGTFLNEPVVRRNVRPGFGVIVDGQLGIGLIPGISAEIIRGRHGVRFSLLLLPLEEDDPGDGSSTVRHEDWRLTYRWHRRMERGFWEAGIAALRVRALWMGGGDTREAVHAVLGIGWGGHWGPSGKVYSDVSVGVATGRSITVVPAIGWAEEMGFDNDSPWFRATVIGVTF